MIKCLDNRLTEMKKYSDQFKLYYIHSKEMINFCDIGGDYRNRLINDMNLLIFQ